MSWNIKTPGDYINGPLTVAGAATFNSSLTVSGIAQLNGNAGIGIAPSAWTNNFKALEIQGGALASNGTSSVRLIQNAYFNSSAWLYTTSARASRYEQDSGGHYWLSAPVGVAGNTVSWNQPMALTNGGDLYLGATGPAYSERMRIYGNYLVLDDGSYSALLGKSSAMGGSSANDFCIRSQQNLLFMAGGATERARFNTTGAFVLAGGATAANGVGIAFPATQSTSTDANTLDDYEEGLWTPVVADAATGGNVGTYVNNGSTYTKIGNQVTVQTYISSINTTGLTGTNAIVIRGLPFAAVRGGQGNFYTYRIGRNALTVSSSAFVSGGTSHVAFNLFGTNSATTDLRILVSDITSGTSEFILTVTYFV